MCLSIADARSWTYKCRFYTLLRSDSIKRKASDAGTPVLPNSGIQDKSLYLNRCTLIMSRVLELSYHKSRFVRRYRDWSGISGSHLTGPAQFTNCCATWSIKVVPGRVHQCVCRCTNGPSLHPPTVPAVLAHSCSPATTTDYIARIPPLYYYRRINKQCVWRTHDQWCLLIVAY